MPDPELQATELLARLRSGESSDSEALLKLLYEDLHKLASQMMASERAGHTLQTTALVNEAWLRIGAEQEDRATFLQNAARAMRRVLVDHARKRGAAKRGDGQVAAQLDEQQIGVWSVDQTEVLALEEVLVNLGEEDPELLRIVELRYFAGLTLEQVAQTLGLTARQVEVRWGFARTWLRRELERGDRPE